MKNYNLQRFYEAQAKTYGVAYAELKNGKKRSHWMWFIFPQIAGLGFSETARFYAIQNPDEAKQFLDDETLSERLISVSKLLLDIKDKTASEIFGSPDNLKLRSSMTLFSLLENTNPVFQQVLDQYFQGAKDEKTIQLMKAGRII